MLLHRCVSMGSEWVDGWTDGQTDAHISMPAVLRAARYATTVDARSPVTVSRCPSPVPIPIPSLSPAPGAALRSIPLCRDAGMSSTELPPARISPLHPRSRPPLTPPPVRISPRRYLQAFGNGAEQHQVHQPPDPPHAAGTPRPRASVSGGHGGGPRLAPGGRGMGGPSRAARPHHRSALGPVRLRSARPGSAPPGAGRCTQLRRSSGGGEEDWGGGERRMPGSAPRGWAVPTHQPPSSPALTPLRSGDAAPGPERLRSSACNVVLPCALAAFRTRKPSSSSSSAQCCVWETSSETGAALYAG